MTAKLQPGTEMVQNTGEQVVTTDVNYKLNKSDDKVIGTANLTATLPDNPTLGESHKFLASAGTITLAGGQFPLAAPALVAPGTLAEASFTGDKWVTCCTEAPIT